MPVRVRRNTRYGVVQQCLHYGRLSPATYSRAPSSSHGPEPARAFSAIRSGFDVAGILDSAIGAAEECRGEQGNAGLWLGCALGELALQGRDKLTIVADAWRFTQERLPV